MTAPPPAPLRVSLDVTTACDLGCRHCRHAAGPGPRAELPLADIRRVVDEAAALGVFRLAISGGEPLLRDDLVTVLLHAAQSKVGRVFLSTNGLRWGQLDREPLRPHRGRLTFKISLDGPPALHDRLRGCPGAGQAAQRAIAALVAEGFDVQVTTTLQRENLEGIADLLQWSERAGCSRHNFVEVVPVGRATPDMVLTPAERRRAVRLLGRARRAAGRRCAVVAKLPFAGGTAQGFRCAGGTEECGILADGSVVGCRLMPDLVEGNIKERSLAEIWSAPEAFPLFRRDLPGRLLTPCNVCEHRPSCLGGCHAFARGLAGSFFAQDARCPHPGTPVAQRQEAPCSAVS